MTIRPSYPIPPRRPPSEESPRAQFEEIIIPAHARHVSKKADVFEPATHKGPATQGELVIEEPLATPNAPVHNDAYPRVKRHAPPKQPPEGSESTMPMGDDDLDSRLAHYARLALAQGTGEDVLAHTQGRAEQRGRLHLRLSLKHAYGIIILLLGVVSASWIWIFLQMQPSEPSRLLGGDGAASGVEGVQQGSAQESTAEAEAGANDMRGTPADDLAGSGQIVVYVSGQVARPGVYYLRQGQRIGEAIAQAGGLSENADDGAVNLAQRAEDGIHIHIPARGEASPNNVQDRERQNVNLNNASAEELQTLPGIGPHLAESIVQWRQKNGQFQEPHDVTKVPGIGESTFAKFADNVTV